MSGNDGSSDGMDGEVNLHTPAFMARLRAAEERARGKPAPLDQVLIEQAKLREDMRELQQRLRSIEEGIQQLARARPRSSGSGD